MLDWFGTEYYHQLYSHRDEQEAREFIDRLLGILDLPPGASLLDLACGRGRHSVYLASKGFDVTGLDLSTANIEFAIAQENPSLSFFVHDMREYFGINRFDAVFSFFTSFGYFELDADNRRVISNVYAALKPGAVFVLDFLNAPVIQAQLVRDEKKQVGDVLYQIHRELIGDMICKVIEVSDKGQKWVFREQVKAYGKDQLTTMLGDSGFEITQTFGSYNLEPYLSDSSPRLILIARK